MAAKSPPTATSSTPVATTSAMQLNMSDSRVRMISSILNICERATLRLEQEGIGNTVKALVIMSLKFVDRETLFRTILPSTFIDWEYVRNQKLLTPGKSNLLGDATAWMHLAEFISFDPMTVPLPTLQEQYAPLYSMHTAIQSSCGQPAAALDFGDACKMLILNNIEGLASRVMIDLVVCSKAAKNMQAICSGIIGKLADERHSAEVYMKAFQYVIGTLMRVDEKLLAQHIAHYKQTRQARDNAWVMKAVQSKICRPSMRKVAAMMASMMDSSGRHHLLQQQPSNADLSSLHDADNQSASSRYSSSSHFGGGTASRLNVNNNCLVVGNVLLSGGSDAGSGVSCITFEQHCDLVRYPNSMSNLRRLRCYLLASQDHHIPYRDYLCELVQSDVAKALAEHPVTIPDPQSLLTCIDSLGMNIRPFDELNQFRTQCFISFASHQKRGLSLTQVLKLYVCAYQVKSIWKQLWTSVYPVISPQIIRDVETFVAKTPFAAKPFVEILRSSSPF